MPDSYAAPDGHKLPVVADAALSERSGSLQSAGPRTYQLPPPRPSGPLQYGSDPFRPSLNMADRYDSGIVLPSSETVPPPHRAELLPPVSQLLGSAAHSSPPASYFPSVYGDSPAVADSRDSPASYRSHDFNLPHRVQPMLIHDAPTDQVDRPFQQQQQQQQQPAAAAAIISPRSQLSPPRATGDRRSFLAASGDSNVQTLWHQPLSRPRAALHHDQVTLHNETAASTFPGAGTGSALSKKLPLRPHVVDEKYIEGEGLCYIYADGSHCPKTIDGLPVNANWGVTKAGKPRKRLAQACLTCREKKIKCHPNLPKCDQCQKSGRECRFESA